MASSSSTVAYLDSSAGPHAEPLAQRVLAGLDLLAIDPIVPAAMRIGSEVLRSLDAIHLATAASITAELGALITYDHRRIGVGEQRSAECSQ